MRGSRWRRRACAVLAVVATYASIHASVGARGATARAATWGTFAHIAANDLSNDAERAAATSAYDVIAIRGNFTGTMVDDLHSRRPGIVLLAYEKAAGLNQNEF